MVEEAVPAAGGGDRLQVMSEENMISRPLCLPHAGSTLSSSLWSPGCIWCR